ncbi:MAG: HAD-IB family hydrolase [Solirubrobacterales bacterium]|nr:HAD-IB family hydrolase [Solirubrobacterales bacterium]
MTSVDALVAEIQDAPEGPQVAAFFDYDGTLISGYSATAFYRHRILSLQLGPWEFVRTMLATARGISSEEEFADFLELSLGAWKGRTVEEMEELSADLFLHGIAGQLHPEAWALVQAHHARGHTVVLASSATRFQVAPMAEEIGAAHVLCTEVETEDGRLTGRATGHAMWAGGKEAAMRRLADAEELDLDACFAYSNGHEDAGFLAAAGHPVCVEPDGKLARLATERDWPVLRCADRGGTPGPVDVARTVAFYGGLAGAAYAGAGIGLLRRSRQTLVDITGGVGADVSLAVAGIEVDVIGTEHLWSARPCIFAFNHQSKIDTILMAKLLRGGFTGVAKKEAANVPGFGQFFRIAGVAFIDRSDGKKAQEAMAPAVDKLRAGTSLVIAPEGTRSPTPRLGPFKKGAFHLAMQAEVPMVPIVIRNAGEVMWRGAQTVRPGRVEVAVLPPLDTSAWTAETVADHVAEVRAQFVHTLAHWPASSKELSA